MRLRELLERNQEEILRRFVEQVRRSDLNAAEVARPLLLNGLPGFLARVTAALDGRLPSLTTEPDTKGTADAAEHGSQRWEMGYDLEELVREYGVLRDVIVGLLSEQKVPVDLEEYRILSRHLSLGVAEAAERFIEHHDDALHRQSSEHLAFLAHELRSPLAVAVMLADGLQARPGDDWKERLSELSESLGQLSRLIDESIISARVRTQPSVRVTDGQELALDDLAAECIQHLRRPALNRGVDVLLHRTSVLVRGDARLLRSAISNLLRNAIKFTQPASVVAVKVCVHDGRGEVSIEDACGGLPAGALDQIFEPFTQAGTDRSGFGLGLAIAKQAAEAHGGSITVLDLPGRGCCFCLELPLA